MAILTKDSSVRLVELTAALAYILYTLEKFHRKKTVTQPENLIITSINDSAKHMPSSRHYQNEAIDLRSRNFLTREDKRIFRQELELYLGSFFRVLLESEDTENEHFHIQVRKGLRYPS